MCLVTDPVRWTDIDHTSSAKKMLRTLSSVEDLENFMVEVAPRLVVVDFHAAWCGPCKFIAPQYAALAERLSASAAFCKVDVDEAQDLAQFARIRAMPTFQVYKAGKQVFEMTGIDLAKLERSIVNESAPVVPPALDPKLPTVVPYRAMMRFEEGQPAVIVGKVLEFADALRRAGHAQVRPQHCSVGWCRGSTALALARRAPPTTSWPTCERRR